MGKPVPPHLKTSNGFTACILSDDLEICFEETGNNVLKAKYVGINLQIAGSVEKVFFPIDNRDDVQLIIAQLTDACGRVFPAN
jgi:hypothetical protein